jgi:hypothetical protein
MRRAAIALAAFVACKGSSSSSPSTSPSTTTTTTTTTTTSRAASTAPPKTSAVVASAQPLTDAGPSACKLLYGPAQQGWKRFGSLALADDGVDVLFNDGGHAKVTHVAAPAGTDKPSEQTSSDPRGDAVYPPCVAAGASVYCAEKEGRVHAAPRAGGSDVVVATTRKSARLYAAPLAGGHALVAYVAGRESQGDWVSEAWAAVDSSPPVRISEEGAGATSLAFAPRGDELVALLVDARGSMTTLHARTLAFTTKLELGPDTVVDVVGPPEGPAPGVALASGPDAAFALVPIARDTSSFGMLAVRVDDPPREDEPMAWSLYPNGTNIAPVAAAGAHVARVVPASSDPKAPSVLELGHVQADGTFASYGFVATHGSPFEIDMAEDAHGLTWLLYADPRGSWLEARRCP